MDTHILIKRDVYAPFWEKKVAPYGVFLIKPNGTFQYGFRETMREAWSLAQWIRRGHANPKAQKNLHPNWHTTGREGVLLM